MGEDDQDEAEICGEGVTGGNIVTAEALTSPVQGVGVPESSGVAGCV